MQLDIPTICFPFIGDTLGGSHISALTLIRNLNESQFKKFVVVHEEGPLTKHLQRLDIPYLHFPLKRYAGLSGDPFNHAKALIQGTPKLVRLLRGNRVQAVHTQDRRMHLTWTLPARLAGCRIIWHQRSKGPPSAMMVRLATRVITPSRFVAKRLPPEAQEKAVLIEHPFEHPGECDRASCRQALLQELGYGATAVEPGPLVVGFFGNLVESKRPQLFAKAAVELSKQIDRPLVFPVFGEDREGHQFSMVTAAKEGMIADRLHFMGFRYPVWPWMAACDLVLAPSVGEAFSRTLVEAMLIGTPIVASRSGANDEAICDRLTGRLFPEDDCSAMVAAAGELLESETLREQIATTALKEALNRFGVKNHVTQVSQLYWDILAMGGKRGDAPKARAQS